MSTLLKDPLLTLSADVLSSAGYATDTFGVERDVLGLRAENPMFVLSVVSAPTMGDLLRLNGVVSAALAQDLSEGMGPKRWDGYLVLLTPEALLDVGDETLHLYELSYDTRVVRRIVRTGVEPELAAIRQIFRPFLPLEHHEVSAFTDPLESLRTELAAQGVSELFAARAVNAFRETKSLRNV